jgi:DNA invertase Pin-like site-specific DNA recombinase
MDKAPARAEYESEECEMTEPVHTRAAQYIRMSTDAQDLSPEIQAKAIEAYSRANGIDVVDTYFDAGRSGLTLHKRSAMKKLLNDVAGEQCPFSVILVYDVSRWGRFQDTDASAYYEYHCRMHGVQVTYVQEPFGADTPLGNVLKSLKRAMAAEFSRELAVKTRAGQRAALIGGFHMGSLPCIGIKRIAVPKFGGLERELGPNEHKAASREHVRWVRGPADEVALVQHIFYLYTTTDISIFKLATVLRHDGRTAANGKPFTPWMLYSLIACEALIGNFVWGREDHGRRRSQGDENFWRVSNCIEPIISAEVWAAAKAKRAKKAGAFRSKEDLLAYLAAAVNRNPSFNASQLQPCDGPSRSSYVKHFGSFAAALACLGLAPVKRCDDDYAHLKRACTLGRYFREVVEAVLSREGVQCTSPRRVGHLLLVNGEARVRVQVIWRTARHGVLQWSLRKIYRESFDHVFLVRLNADDTVFDSLLLPRDQYFGFKLWFDDNVVETTFERQWSGADVAAKFRQLRAQPDATLAGLSA